MSKLEQQILDAVRGRHPLIYLQTPEEDRILTILHAMVGDAYPGGQVFAWDCVSGWDPAWSATDTRDPVEAVKAMLSTDRPGFYLMKDLTAFMDRPELVRILRDAYYTLLQDATRGILLISPRAEIPTDIEKEVCLVEVGWPDQDELMRKISEVQAGYAGPGIDKSLYSEITLALRGLTLNEVGHVMHRVCGGGKTDADSLLQEVFAEKKMLVKKTGFLEFISQPLDMERIGGLENVKEWAEARKNLFTREALEKGAPIPRGVLIMGVSGCGKSLLAKAIAHHWHVPLFRLDMNLIFSGVYGSPEAAFHHALKTIEAVSPAVLWIDEIENGLGMTAEGSTIDQSLTFSAFLTWMQEKPPLVFVAATANRIESLPAEIIRKGRFDQVFFCDLPNEDERRKIIDIHLKLNGAEPGEIEPERLLIATEGWSGAEIEQAIISARVDALHENRRFNTDDVKRHTGSMVPLSKTMAEQIKTIRRWAFDRATLASKAKRLY